MTGDGKTLIERLLEEHSRRGFLNASALERVSRSLTIPHSRAFAVAGQLEHFSLQRQPEREVDVCCGPACALAGSAGLYEDVLGAVEQKGLNVQVECTLGIPYWHTPVLSRVRGPKGGWSAWKVGAGALPAVMSIVDGGSPKGANPLVTDTGARGKSVSPRGERFAHGRAAAKKRGGALRGWDPKVEELMDVGPAGARRLIEESRLVETMSGRELAEILEALSGAAPRILVCDVGGREPENSPGPALAALDPVGVIEGMMIAAAALEASDAFLFLPYEDVELRALFEKVLGKAGTPPPLKGPGIRLLAVPNLIPCDREIGTASFLRGLTLSEGVSAAADSRELLWKGEALFSEPEVFLKLSALASSGARAYRGIKGGGTRVVSVGGRVKRPCLVEAPLGTAIHELLGEYAGGIDVPGGLKALHFGGAFGYPLKPAAMRSSLGRLFARHEGASGQVLAIDGRTCMVQWSEYFARIAERLCCGACVPGRLGPIRVAGLLEKISTGLADIGVIGEIKATIELIRETSLCPQGARVLNPVITAIDNFSSEFERHVTERKCDAGVCGF